jgi:hypothetical protein
MARNFKEITVEGDNRDKDKRYLITELPASQGEKWAMRALALLAKSGISLPEGGVEQLGMAGIARLGFEALMGINFLDLEPLLDEMMTCVRALPASGQPRKLQEEDIEEISTRLMLRKEVFELHTAFFGNGGLSTLSSGTGTPQQTSGSI